MKKIFTLVLIGASSISFSQFDFNPKDLLKVLSGTMESDRPGQALNARTCGILTAQIQTGGNFQRWNVGPDNSMNIFSTPTQIRFGLFPKFEINTSFSFVNVNQSTFIGPITTSGFPSPNLGARYTVLEGDGLRPFVGVQASMSFPSSRGTYQQPQLGSSFYLITSNRFDKFSVNTNVGAVFGGGGSGQVAVPYVFNLGFSLNDKWGAFIEAFGSLRNPTLAVDGGFSFLALPTLQLDAFGGWFASSAVSNNFFVELGLTWKYSFLEMIAKKKLNEMLGGGKK